jgi:hypothetical protein
VDKTNKIIKKKKKRIKDMVQLQKEEDQLVQIQPKQIMEDSLKQEDGLMDSFQ